MALYSHTLCWFNIINLYDLWIIYKSYPTYNIYDEFNGSMCDNTRACKGAYHIDELVQDYDIPNAITRELPHSSAEPPILTLPQLFIFQIHTGLQHLAIFLAQRKGLHLRFETLADRLLAAGYSTNIIGKWHIGFFKKEYTPNYRGFQNFFGMWH